MKKALALVATLVSLAFMAGRANGSQKSSSQPLVVKAPDVHVSTQGHQPQSRLERHRVLVDPYILLVVTLISVLLSGAFAGLTWQVNQGQKELLEQQTDLMTGRLEVQRASSLPIFELTFERLVDENGFAYERVGILNVGGMARYQESKIHTNTDIYMHYNDGTRSVYGSDDFWNHGYMFASADPVERSQYWQQDQFFETRTSEHTASKYWEGIKRHLAEEYDMAAGFFFENIIEVTYTDYQGIFREEYYGFSYMLDPNEDWQSDFDPGDLVVLGTKEALSLLDDEKTPFSDRLWMIGGLRMVPYDRSGERLEIMTRRRAGAIYEVFKSEYADFLEPKSSPESNP